MAINQVDPWYYFDGLGEMSATDGIVLHGMGNITEYYFDVNGPLRNK